MDSKVTLISCWFLGMIFLYAGFDKLFHYEGFVRALSSYSVFPSGAPRYMASSIILVELVVGLGLLRSRWRKSAALLSAGMLFIFTLALAINYWTNPEAICGCWFTITLGRGTGQHILQNLIMAGLSLTVFLTEKKEAPAMEPEVNAA